MKHANWNINGFDRDAAVALVRGGINPLVSVLLASRGISDIKGARALMGDGPPEIHDPFLMAGMDSAVARIKSAVANNERIVIYGDYDVDGMTSCALMALWLRSKGANYEIYIPDRVDEGYGLSCAALDTLRSFGIRLVITVDCGVTAIEEAEYAREIGLDLVITDHHECKPELPAAAAIINPKRPGCAYPNKALAGVGVVFKLLCALESPEDCDALFRRYGDLVAIGTIADVMPVVGENRELIRRGLAILNDSPNLGINKLLSESAGGQDRIGASAVSYLIAPKLNAAGRMGRTEISLEILLTEDEAEAGRLTGELISLNLERRRIENEILEEAKLMLSENGTDGPIVLARRGWHQGVTGIVAAKLADSHMLPAIMISIDEDGVGRGSCRSFGLFSIYEALGDCGDLLVTYGGHDLAAGLTIDEENIDELRQRIGECFSNSAKHVPSPGLRLDFEVEKPELLTLGNVEALGRLEPFGSGNPPPYMCIQGALLNALYPIGSGKHSRLRLERSGKSFDCVYFGMPPEKLGVSEGMRVDVAFEPQINDYRGRSVQLHLLDIRETK